MQKWKFHLLILLFKKILQLVMHLTKLPEATASLIMSMCPSSSMKQRLPRDEFSLNLIFTCFSKICLENTIFITILQE